MKKVTSALDALSAGADAGRKLEIATEQYRTEVARLTQAAFTATTLHRDLLRKYAEAQEKLIAALEKQVSMLEGFNNERT